MKEDEERVQLEKEMECRYQDMVALLSSYGLDWDWRDCEILLGTCGYHALFATDDEYKEERDVMSLFRFLKLVQYSDVRLIGKVVNEVGGNRKGWEVDVSLPIGWILRQLGFMKMVEQVGEWYRINPRDYNEVSQFLEDTKFFTSQNEKDRESELKKKRRKGLARSAWAYWVSLGFEGGYDGWTDVKKYCLVSDLMALCGLKPKRERYGEFKGRDMGNDVRDVERWIKQEREIEKSAKKSDRKIGLDWLCD